MGYDDDRADDFDEFDDDGSGFYGYDDDRRAAYRRALSDFIYDDYILNHDPRADDASDDREFFIEFADMVQHYDDTARGTHDDIDDDDRDFDDGTEFDANGDPVITYGVLIAVIDAVLDFGSFDDIPDDYDFGADEDDGLVIRPLPDGFSRHRFPLYNPFRQPCKRPRAFRIYGQHPDSPPV